VVGVEQIHGMNQLSSIIVDDACPPPPPPLIAVEVFGGGRGDGDAYDGLLLLIRVDNGIEADACPGY
jgi:hypothetical protein